MKQTLLVAILALLFIGNVGAQNGYIYIHQKTLNEQSAVDFSYSVTGPSSYSKSFQLNSNPAFLQVGDIGAGHGGGSGSYGDGELWAIANASAIYNVTPIGLQGTIYRRQAESAQWTALTNSPANNNSATAIDGAYYNECVFISGGNVWFNYNNTLTQIYNSGDAIDVSAGNGVIAIITTARVLKVYNKQYVSGASINTTAGAWTSFTGLNLFYTNATQSSRLDINVSGSLIAFTYYTGTTETLYTVGVTVAGGTASTAGTVTQGSTTTINTFTTSTDAYGNTVGGRSTNPDVAFDDKGKLYVIANSIIYNGGDVTYSNNSGSFVYEPQSRNLERITAGAGGQAWGVLGTGTHDAIWARTTEGSHIWVDDERVRLSGTNLSFKTGGGSGTGNTNNNVTGVANGDVIILPVPAGTYTITQTLPNSSWDLGRFQNYVPGTSSVSTNVNTQTVTITVAANDVAHIIYINEKLSPAQIALNCNTQILEDFSSGSNTFGDTVQGTSYHYYPQGSNGTPTAPQDGDYYTVKDLSHWFINNGLISHDGNSNGYYLVVNASYALDEFYRKRVTNLVPGLSYTISFYAANINYTTGNTTVRIPPNVSYGLQDASGNIIASASTGSIDTTGPSRWNLYSFTFTATTSQADLFFRNNTIGGLGNDIALDDLSLNPVITTLGANQITPTVAPNLCIGTSYTFSNTPTGGIWSSSSAAIASINPRTGVAITNAAGKVVITYTYTNQVGCVSDTTRELDVTAAPNLTTSDLLGNTSCLNQTDSLYAVATGTATPFTYLWSASPTGNGLGATGTATTSAAPTAAGTYTYTVTATDAVGCAATGTVTLAVSANTAPTVSITTTGSSCVNNSGNFTLTANRSGGTPAYSYVWSATPTGSGVSTSPAPTTQSISPVATAAGTYTYKVIVSDQFCHVPVFKTATVNATPAVIVTPATGSVTLCSGGSIALTAAVTTTTTSPYTYSWSATGTGNGLSGTPTTASTTATPTGAGTYTYTVNLTDANGCKASGSSTQTVAFNNSLVTPTLTITQPASAINGCTGQGSVNLRATSTGGGLAIITYLWSGPGTISNPTSLSSASVVPTSTGVYTLTATSTIVATGTCTTSVNTPVVTANVLPAVTAVDYANDICTNTKDTVYATGSGGTTPYSYAWSVSPSGASATTPTAATSAISVTTYGTSYTFTMTITDANGCTATGSKVITALNKTGPSYSSITGASNFCLGSKSLSASVSAGTASSSLSYAWTGSSATSGIVNVNATSTTATPTVAGTYKYYITTTDGAGCKATDSTGLQTALAVPSLSPLASNPSFCGAADSINLYANPTGGSGSYSTFAWSYTQTGSATVTITPNAATQNPTANVTSAVSGKTFTFTVTVTDANTCTATASTNTITASNVPVITATSVLNSTACVGKTIDLTGKVTSGTTAPYSYSWTASSNSVVTPSSVVSSATTITASGSTTAYGNYQYALAVLDANNCQANAATTSVVAINDTPSVAVTAVVPTPLCANPVSTITLNAVASNTAGGSSTFSSYAWTGANIVTTPTATGTTTAKPTTSGYYAATVTDGNGCKGTGYTSAAINVDLATPSIVPNNCGTTPGGTPYVELVETNGSSWLWSTAGGTARFYTSSALSVLTDSTTSHLQGPYVTASTTYNVQITDGSGCIGSGSYTITNATCGVVLPIKLLSFTAQKEQDKVALNWSTISELNSNYFIIQRSGDDSKWQDIGTVKSHNNSNTLQSYSFDDGAPLIGANYYRLKQVDMDGKIAYSEERLVRFSTQWAVHVYPNPASDFIVLEFNNDKEERASISVQTTLGSTVFMKEQKIAKGYNRIILNQIQPLAQGTYIITLATSTNLHRSRFIKGDK